MDWHQAQESRLLDPAAVARLRELGGDDLLHEFVRLFRPVAETRIRALHQAVADADADALRQAAHTLHGTASNIGAVRLMRMAVRLEELAIEGAEPEWSPMISEIEIEARQIIRFLSS